MKIKEKMKELCKVTKIGEFAVKCFQPVSHTKNQRAIYQIRIETTEEEIMECLQLKDDQKEIIAERMFNTVGGVKKPTTAIKLTFNNRSNKVKEIFLGRLRYKMHPYIERPIQCYKCQGVFHMTDNCFAKTKCVVCSGPHSVKECNKTHLCCSNCRGNHTASYAGYPRMKQAAEVQEIKAKNDITQKEAINVLRNRTTATHEPHKEVITGNAWERPLVWTKTKEIIVNAQSRQNMVETRCQTEAIGEKPKEPTSIIPDSNFFNMIIELIMKIPLCKDQT